MFLRWRQWLNQSQRAKQKVLAGIALLSIICIFLFTFYLSLPIRSKFTASLLMSDISFTYLADNRYGARPLKLIGDLVAENCVRISGLSDWTVKGIRTSRFPELQNQEVTDLQGRNEAKFRLGQGGLVFLGSSCVSSKIIQNTQSSELRVSAIRIPPNTSVESLKYVSDTNRPYIFLELNSPKNFQGSVELNLSEDDLYVRLQNASLNGKYFTHDIEIIANPESSSLNVPILDSTLDSSFEDFSIKVYLQRSDKNLDFPDEIRVKDFQLIKFEAGDLIQDTDREPRVISGEIGMQGQDFIDITDDNNREIKIKNGDIKILKLLGIQEKDSKEGLLVQVEGTATGITLGAKDQTVSRLDLMQDDFLEIVIYVFLVVFVTAAIGILTTILLKYVE